MEAKSQVQRCWEAFRLSLGVCLVCLHSLHLQGWEVSWEEKWLRRL